MSEAGKGGGEEGRGDGRGGSRRDDSAATENAQEVEAITQLTKTRCRPSRHTRSISWTNTSLPPMMFEEEDEAGGEDKAVSGSSAAPVAARTRPRRHSEHNTSPHRSEQKASTHQPQTSPRRRVPHHSRSPSAHRPPPEIAQPIPEHNREAQDEDEDAADVLAQLQRPFPTHGSWEDLHAGRARSNSDTGLLTRARKGQSRDHNKALAYWRLEKEYRLVKDKLVAKAEECNSLAQYKEQLTREMDDLTESLFEEAHNMVRTAKEEAAKTEKRYVEAASKVEMLTAEVSALKTIVEHQREQLQPRDSRSLRLGAPARSRGTSQTRTQSPTQAQRRASASPPAARSSGRGFRRHFFRRQNSQTRADAAGKGSKAGHKRQGSAGGGEASVMTDEAPAQPETSGDGSPAVQAAKTKGDGASAPQDADVKKAPSRSSSTSSRNEQKRGTGGTHAAPSETTTSARTPTGQHQQQQEQQPSGGGGAGVAQGTVDDDDDDADIVDKRLLEHFAGWYKKPDLNAPYITSLEQGEMTRTLNVCEPSSPIQIPDILAAIKEQSLVIERLVQPSKGRKCAVTGRGSPTHRIRLGSQTEWIDVSETVRDRIASVCDCYVYLRYIQQGLVKVGAKRAFIKLAMHRQQMMNALLGLRLYESVL